MRSLSILLLLVLLGLQYRLWIGDGSFTEVHRLRGAIDTQRTENARLAERNRRLYAEVQDLRDGLDAIEERARRELGMLAKDETFFQIVDE